MGSAHSQPIFFLPIQHVLQGGKDLLFILWQLSEHRGHYDTAKARYDEVVAAISAKEAQSERLADFIKVLI